LRSSLATELQAIGIESGYGRLQVLWGVDLEVRSGESILLLGANGAGKTTLLRAVIGLLPIWRGELRWDGQEISRLRPDQRIARGLAYMSEMGVIPELSVEENLRLGGYRLSYRDFQARKRELLEFFPDLASRLALPAGSLSGGQRKMLGIAKALMSRPRLLIMDEPSSGLSPRFVGEVLRILSTLHRQGLSLLIAEQNVSFLEIAERGYVLEGGRVRLSGPVEALKANDAVRRAYLGVG
jgi:branched-chain amino acid transport system ATP-binding protein